MSSPPQDGQGEDLDGKSLLIWGEQGIGDEILFLTLLPEVLKRGPSRIGILASDKICPVLARWYPDAEIFAIGDIRDKMEQELGSRFDLHLPAGSLPLVLDRMDASGTKHYLSDSEISNQLKQELLDQFPGKERVIGLSWRSGVLTHKRVQYYLSHQAIIDLLGQRRTKSCLSVFNTVLTMTRLETSVRSQTYSFQMKISLDDLMAQMRYIKACDLVVTSGSVCLALCWDFRASLVSPGDPGGLDPTWYRTSIPGSRWSTRSSVSQTGTWVAGQQIQKLMCLRSSTQEV